MRTTLVMTLLAALLLAPLAVAEGGSKDDNSTRPDDAAWVEDCPPDMMCAYSHSDANQSEPARGPADGSCENCRGDNISYGPDDCIECSGPVSDGGTCMDGADAGEACDDDVQYIGGPSGAPPQSEAEPVSANADDAKSVPGAGLALVALAAGLAVLVAARRR